MSTHHLFLLSSARRGGNTEQLARKAAEALPAHAKQTWIDLKDHPLPMFEDVRHSVGTYPPPEGAARVLLEATLEATDLVLVAPLYWYSLPTLAQRYLDEWSGWMRVPDLNFKAQMEGRNLHAITVHTGEKEEVQPLLLSLQHTARYMKMHYRGALVGWVSRPGDVLQDQHALEQAKTFFTGANHD
ncbi:flavodoxin family protein [Deinococcus cellulosilyticus]|uniref:Flavodoxin n=1 Tax=Deinococcus cellulosilyticus (strain DSM 18568 / NBRC 106333 / KACC 11606 / 5516J-15) TaxID=1223518 RepID=A0A511MVA2_DEIC1|nr:NAD(P)H-dependent oxidoreductase [Deinococcus cellulosilyticus]GEM44505.1 flavodoxin [Deinococcus cellulosilyticus NBRC 106333 = KACC 11606]